jgi:predicted Zn-dependent protease
MNRLERIRQMAEASPQDPFPWYSLAMEQKKTDIAAALAIFRRVHDQHPAYVPNYYHYARALEESGDLENARRVYAEGISAAEKARDAHAVSELRAALDLLA